MSPEKGNSWPECHKTEQKEGLAYALRATTVSPPGTLASYHSRVSLQMKAFSLNASPSLYDSRHTETCEVSLREWMVRRSLKCSCASLSVSTLP